MTDHKNKIVQNQDLLFYLIENGIQNDNEFKVQLIEFLEKILIDKYFFDENKDEMYFQIVELINELKAFNK